MKGKLLIFLFGVAFMTFAQLLVYYFNPTNWATLESALKNPVGLIYNMVWVIAPLLMLILLWRMIRVEDKHEKEEQAHRDTQLVQSLTEAFKKALKEDTEEERKDNIKKSGDW